VGVVGRAKPDLLICNGPGTCLPVVICVFMGRVLGCFGEGKVVFCESFCRVKTISLTGRLIYPIVDRFVVHWEELQKEYPMSDLIESFIREGGADNK